MLKNIANYYKIKEKSLLIILNKNNKKKANVE